MIKDYLKKLFIGSDDIVITYEEMTHLDYNVNELYPGITTQRIPTYKSTRLLFVVSMAKDSVWPNHSHDCKEIVTLIKGELAIMGINILPGKIGHVIFPNIPHTTLALEDTQFIAEFIKP